MAISPPLSAHGIHDRRRHSLVSKNTFAIESYGVRIGFHIAGELYKDILLHLPPAWASTSLSNVQRYFDIEVCSGEVDSRYRLSIDGKVAFETGDRACFLEHFESDLQLFVAEMSKHYVFVHAGVVALHGKAVLFPGRSFSGKTTLVHKLLQAGLTYYSDEYAVLDSHGLVLPYPRRLSIRQSISGPRLRKLPAEMGWNTGSASIPVDRIIFTSYSPEATWSPAAVTQGRAILAMMDHTVPIRRCPERSLEVLSTAIKNASVLTGPRGEAEVFVRGLLASTRQQG